MLFMNTEMGADLLINFLKSLLMPVAVGLVCGWFVTYQAKRSFGKREFLDRVNFSLNILKDGRLLIRTLMEKPGDEVFLNPLLVKIVNHAATKTTREDCLLPINPKDYWFCLNALLNEVSEKFSAGFLKQDLNQPVDATRYVMCLTCEVAPNIKTRKVRVMLIKKSLLENFPATDPLVDFESHTVRIVTLRQLARDYQNEEKKHCFIEVELCT